METLLATVRLPYFFTRFLGAEDTFLGNPHFFLYTDCAFRSGYGIRGVNVEFLHVGHGESLQIALLFGSECTWTFLAALAPELIFLCSGNNFILSAIAGKRGLRDS